MHPCLANSGCDWYDFHRQDCSNQDVPLTQIRVSPEIETFDVDLFLLRTEGGHYSEKDALCQRFQYFVKGCNDVLGNEVRPLFSREREL